METCERCGATFPTITGRHRQACANTPPPSELACLYITAGRPPTYRFADSFDTSRRFINARLRRGLEQIGEDTRLTATERDQRRQPVRLLDENTPTCERCELIIHSDKEIDIGLCHYCIDEVGIAWQS